jgi:UPF0042 nucleotide-binding protein
LLPELAAFLSTASYPRVALSIDARSGANLQDLPRHVSSLRSSGIDVKVLFLEAKAGTLINRFSETRRRHPLSDGNLTLPECIARERELLGDIANFAHHVDTSDLQPNALRSWVKDFVGMPQAGLTLLFQSFGFKNGIPLDADLVFDVRCLPNPHYDPKLRPLTGMDQDVIDFLKADSNAQKMLDDIRHFVGNWLPCFIRDNRSYLTVAIGCTGGRHRSVYLAEMLAAHFRPHTQLLVRHRELP